MSTDLTPTPLAIAASLLVQQLGGQWRPHGSMCHCPAHADRTPSLSVRVGRRSLLFKCFAGCPTDDVLRAIRRLNLDVPILADDHIPLEGPADAVMTERARRLWDAADRLAGSPGVAYLRSRGITTVPQGLRWHPRTPLGRGRDVRFRPAILAAVQERSSIVAIQRLFVDPVSQTLAPDLVKPKRTLGRPGAGAVRLRPVGRRLGLAEGIENAESAAILLDMPAWATLGSERLHQILIPDCVEELVLLPDYDGPGRRAEHLARETYIGRSFTVTTLWPWANLNDWNDVLRKGGKEVGTRVRMAA